MDDFKNVFLQASRPVRYAATAALGMLALFLLIATINATEDLGRTEFPYSNTITVDGSGTSAMVPDLARVYYSITEQGATVAEAQDKATERNNAAIDALKEQGIEEKDIRTTSYNVSPRYEYPQPCYAGVCPPAVSSPRIIGYEVSQTLEVKVRDTAKAGSVLETLGSLGVQNISGPNFGFEEDDAARTAARAEAIAEAKAKAKQLAKDLGVRLGRVVSFNEGGIYPTDYYGYGKGGVAMDMAESRPVPQLPTGETETTVSVTITYEIY